MTMKSKTWLILLTFTVVLLLAYSGKVTSGYFSDGESSTNNVLRYPFLGSADSFVVLAYSGITNTGATTITGDIGSYPTDTVPGSITLNGTNHGNDAVTQGAKDDLTTAYNDAAGQTPFTTVTGDTLGGLNLAPGVYRGGALSLTGNLTLTGNETDVWIFQAASTLITADGSQVIMSGGAKAANVYWVVGSSATLGGAGVLGSHFEGNILAHDSITVNKNVVIVGRALAQTAAVTLDTNIITKPAP